MVALILSCSTGGGHDSAAKALQEVFEKNGDQAVVLNPYALYSKRKESVINRTYISVVQKCPSFFGFIYKLANRIRKLPCHSPVYAVNRKSVQAMAEYLKTHQFDVIICTHLFPAEILTKLKNKGTPIPKTLFIATDYTCIPFTEETDCDYYVIPSIWQTSEFAERGIDRHKLRPLGIPVQKAFIEQVSKEEAKKALGLDLNTRYVLICGGSMGAGNFTRIIDSFLMKKAKVTCPIVVCGHNKKLCRKLSRKYGKKIMLIGQTDKMALLMRASDLYLTKPGGLSSTEAAAIGVPLVHLPPIPGCETANAAFFSRMGMSVRLSRKTKNIGQTIAFSEDMRLCDLMIHYQQTLLPKDAAERIYQFALLVVAVEVKGNRS